MHVTNSSMSCFKTCRRKFFYSYILGWKPSVDKAPLRIGSAVHEGIDMLAKGMDLDDALKSVAHMYDLEIRDCDIQDLDEYNATIKAMKYERITAVCLVTGYHRAWQDSEIRILQSEAHFDLPIVNPATNTQIRVARQAGVRDRVGLLPDGRVALMETKTVGEDISPESSYRNVLAINQQVSMYLNAAIQEGIDTVTTIYDCVRKPTIRPNRVAQTDSEGLPIVLDADLKRVLKKDGTPRKTGDKAKGYELQYRDMTESEWYDKLMQYILGNPEEYYQRFEVARTQDELQEFKFELYEIAQDIHACKTSGRWYKNTSACRKWNSTCPYFGLCSKQLSSESCPQGFVEVENVHQEIKELQDVSNDA